MKTIGRRRKCATFVLNILGSLAVIVGVPHSTFGQTSAPAVGMPFRDCTEQFDACFGLQAIDPNGPFILQHGKKTQKVALVVHGLSDSPYQMKDVANALYQNGLNVVAIRLAGHGTHPADLIHVILADWRTNVNEGMKVAKILGDETVGVGFSAGGALVIQQAAVDPQAFKGLILFAPAVKIANPKAYQSCLPFADKIAGSAYAPGSIPDSPVKYGEIALNAVCKLFELTLLINLDQAALTEPTLTFVTTADQTVDVSGQMNFMRTISSPIRHVVLFKNKDEDVTAFTRSVSVHSYNTAPVTHTELTLKDNVYTPASYNRAYPIIPVEIQSFLNHSLHGTP